MVVVPVGVDADQFYKRHILDPYHNLSSDTEFSIPGTWGSRNSPIVIPLEVWALIMKFIPAWELGPYLLLKLSHISSSARIFFLSDKFWQPFNPYEVQMGIASHFIHTLAVIHPMHRRDHVYVWGHAAARFTLRSTDHVLMELHLGRIPCVNDYRATKYYRLGLLVALTMSLFRKTEHKYLIHDKGIMMAAVQIHPLLWKRASTMLKLDRDLAVMAARSSTRAARLEDSSNLINSSIASECFARELAMSPMLSFFTGPMRDDPKVNLECIKHNYQAATRLSRSLMSKEPVWRELLDCYPQHLAAMFDGVDGFTVDNHPFLVTDFPFIVSLVKRCKYLLTFLDPKNITPCLVWEIFEDNTDALLEDAQSRKLHIENRDWDVGSLASGVGQALDGARIPYADHKEMALRLVAWNGEMLEFLDHDLLADRDIAMVAVNNYGRSIRLLDETLRFDLEVMLAAVDSDPLAMEFTSDLDHDVVLNALERDGRVFDFLPQERRGEWDFVNAAIRTHPQAILDSNLIDDMELMYKAVKVSPTMAPPEVYGVKRIAWEVIRDPEFIMNHWEWTFDDWNWADEKEFVLRAVSVDGSRLRLASPRLRDDFDVCYAASWGDPDAIIYMSDRQRSDIRIQSVVLVRSGWNAGVKSSMWV